MKKLLIFLVILAPALPVLCFADDVNVRGYYRDSNHDGVKDTYVQPYHRTSPDTYRSNNYNYPGNYNPNTGHITGGQAPLYSNPLAPAPQRRGW
jgi:hypothetical protein